MFDLSQNFEKTDLEDGEKGWSVPGRRGDVCTPSKADEAKLPRSLRLSRLSLVLQISSTCRVKSSARLLPLWLRRPIEQFTRSP